MKIGYSAWGFVGDGVLDSPDGGRLTRSLFLSHLITRGHTIVWLQQNRDIDENGNILFCKDRIANYKNDWEKTQLCQLQYDEGFPEVDVLFLEWRWPIPGRNFLGPDMLKTIRGGKGWTPDLDRQTELLKYYTENTQTKIAIWDKDETMTITDEIHLISQAYHINDLLLTDHMNVNIEDTRKAIDSARSERSIIVFSPALFPPKHLFTRHTLLFPCDLDKIRGTKVNNNIQHLIGYVGSQYERDEQVYKYINPFSFKHPHQVVFAGNWMKYPEKAKHNEANFPCILFQDRILPKDMWKIYRFSLTTVLMCKKNYAEHGHVTQRIHEAATNGVIAIGLKEQTGIERFILEENIVDDAYELIARIDYLQALSVDKRQEILDKQIEMLAPFDIKQVLNVFEKAIV
jgi:hypothetical protein